MKKRLQSCLYRATVFHRRLAIREHAFRAELFTWFLDLDELPLLDTQLSFLFGLNKAGLFSFKDSDHFRFEPEASGSIRERINKYLERHGQPVPARVMLLTNLRFLGYGFNPVSFYFALDEEDRLCSILTEVNNTYGEQKPYLLVLERPVPREANQRIRAETWKNFYVSPFLDRDLNFRFSIKYPDDLLSIGIDTCEGQKPVLRAAYSGKRQTLSSGSVLAMVLRFPFVTFKVIALIHWHALRLFLKKIPHYGKESTDELIRRDEEKRKEVTNATV